MTSEFEAALEQGIDLFNQKDFEGAYQVWLDRWSEEDGDGADMLQGLLQLAAGLAKVQGGDLRGALKLLTSGTKLLQPYVPESHGVDVGTVIEQVTTVRTKVETALGGAGGGEG